MKTILTFLLGLAIVGAAPSSSHAQYLSQGAATWRWEASLDGGASWQGGLVESLHNPGIVLVRAIVTFETFGAACYLGGTRLDPFVTTPAWAEGGDDILSYTTPHGPVTRLLTLPIQPQRMPGILKLDLPGDTSAPGEGSGFISVFQPGYQTVTTPIFDNPMWAMGFTLQLAPSGGDRTVQGAFRDHPSYPGRPLFVETRPWQGFGYAQTLTQEPVTIRIVPAPSAVALGVVALVFGGRRRR